MNKKKKYLLALILLMILTSLGVFIYLSPSTPISILMKDMFSTSRGVRDCNDSRQCFLESFSKCELAKVKIVKNTIEGTLVYAYSEIKGNTTRGCQTYIYTDYSKDRFGGNNTEDYCYQLQLGEVIRRGSIASPLNASQCEDQSRGDNRSI